MTKCVYCEQEAMDNDIMCKECREEDWNEYCKTVSAAYWAEEDEMKAGVHPSQ